MSAYDTIFEKIEQKLMEGTVPWRQPWSGGGLSGGMPKNLVSGNQYKGINTVLLFISTMENGYQSPNWGTIKQINQQGGRVLKGEKSTKICFFKMLEPDKTEADGKTLTDQPEARPMLRIYSVFNTDQTTLPKVQTPIQEAEFTPIEKCENVVDGMPNRPRIVHAKQRAFYRISGDFVNMPRKESFESAESYYATLFHELGHSTGHKSRLDRGLEKNKLEFGNNQYSKEELIAEFTSSFLCAESGISPATLELSASYIDHWLTVLRNKKAMLVQAASAAQKAADYILNRR